MRKPKRRKKKAPAPRLGIPKCDSDDGHNWVTSQNHKYNRKRTFACRRCAATKVVP